ncbi:MAG: hypothetical protein V1747_07845 [Candidatus Omnitrophota bacterium]
MNYKQKSKFRLIFRVIASVLLQAFLFTNFAWCGADQFIQGNTVCAPAISSTTISPAIQVTEASIQTLFVQSAAFQMGKRAEFKGLDSLKQAEVENALGDKFSLSLNLKGKLNTASVIQNIEKRTDIKADYKKILNAMILEFGKLDVKFYSYETLVEDLFGFASAGNKMIAIHSSVFSNPIAQTHEIGEFLAQAGMLNFSLGQDDQLLISLNGSLIGRIKLSEDALAIAKKDPSSNHYLLRAFQREVFQDKDRALTAGIKNKQGDLSSAMKIFLKTINAETGNKVEASMSLSKLNDPMFEALFKDIEFNRFSENDAAKLKIAILLQNNIAIEPIAEPLLQECGMLNKESADLYETIFPAAGTPGFSPKKLFAKENVNPDNLHLIFELAKRYSPIKAFSDKLDRIYRELALYTLPVSPGARYHISLLKDLNSILLSGGRIKESKHSLSGQGVYFFEMGNSGLVNAQTRLAEFFPFISSSPHDLADADYVVKAFRQKIARDAKDNARIFPVVIQVAEDIPAEAAMGWAFREDYKKAGKLIRDELNAQEYEFLINLNYLYLSENQAVKNHLLAKNIIREENGIIRLVDASRAIQDENKKNTGWARMRFADLRYEVINLSYTKLDSDIQKLSAKMAQLLQNLLADKMSVSSVVDTGSSNRGLTVENPDFDFLIKINSPEDFTAIVKLLLDEKILENFLKEHKAAFEAIYGDKSVSIVTEQPHAVGKGNLYLFPFKFVAANRIVGGVDFNFSKLSAGKAETLSYHETARQQLQAILDKVPEAEQKQLSRYLAGEIKTLKKLIINQGLYKDKDTKRNRFIGVAVEQMIYNLSDYLSMPSNISTAEIKSIFSIKTALYLISRMESERLNGLSFSLYQRANGSGFSNQSVKYDLRDNEKSVIPKVGTAFAGFKEFSEAENAGVKNKIKGLITDFISRPGNKVKIIEFFARYNNEVDAAIALGQAKPFSNWEFFERWEFTHRFFTLHKTEIDIFAIDKTDMSQDAKLKIAEMINGLKAGITESMGVSEDKITGREITRWFKTPSSRNKQLRDFYFQYGAITAEPISILGFAGFLMNIPALRSAADAERKAAPLSGIINRKPLEQLVGQSI